MRYFGLIASVSLLLLLCPHTICEEQPTPVAEVAEQVIVEEEPITFDYLGEFKLTAYCSCEKCCGEWAKNRPQGVVYGASGEILVAGYSVAVDPKIIDYGTEIIIDGKTYRADDCGGAIKGNRIDVYFDNHEDALRFGVQHADVFMVI